MNLQGQLTLDPRAEGSMGLSGNVYHLVGTTPAVLTAPAGDRQLVLDAEVGGWRVKRFCQVSGQRARFGWR